MSEPREAFREIFGVTVSNISEDELQEIDELRRFAADVSEPEASGYTLGISGTSVPEYTVHFRTVVR